MPAPSNLTTKKLTNYLSKKFGTDINATHVRIAARHFGVQYATATKRLREYYVQRGTWSIDVEQARKDLEVTVQAPAAEPAEQKSFIPDKDPNFVPFGNFSDVKKIIQSKLFYPTFVTGLSGNGKTLAVEQACAQLNRELIRVNITIETDEDDLIGGFRLVNGETVWHNGPVVEALERGAVLQIGRAHV